VRGVLWKRPVLLAYKLEKDGLISRNLLALSKVLDTVIWLLLNVILYNNFMTIGTVMWNHIIVCACCGQLICRELFIGRIVNLMKKKCKRSQGSLVHPTRIHSSVFALLEFSLGQTRATSVQIKRVVPFKAFAQRSKIGVSYSRRMVRTIAINITMVYA
jgi:hypothetical protein